MRVLMIAPALPPSTAPAAGRAGFFARTLATAGHHVHVLTLAGPAPIAPQDRRGAPAPPPDAVGPGVVVERLGRDSAAAGAPGGAGSRPALAWRLLRTALVGERPDVVLAVDPPWPLAGSAWIAARLRRAPLVLDWDEGAAATPAGASDAADGSPSYVERHVHRVLAGSEEARRLLERRGLDSGRIEVVGAECEGTSGAEARESDEGRAPVGRELERVLQDVVRRARGRDVRPRPAGPYRVIRRALDVGISATLLLVLSPVLAVLAIAIRLDSPGPALFRQRRIGRGSSEFTILKFRTMKVGTPDLASHLMGPGSSRVTQLGRFLRRTSTDELPQLWNVLTGDMTLIGPRPALYNQDDLIAMRQEAGVDALKPGLTGWAQVNGRDDIPLEQKVAYDRHYLERVSPALDLAIAVRTVAILFSDRGVF